jgi:hypothetical protein
MPQLHTKLSDRMAKKRSAKSRDTMIMLPFADLPKVADVLFLGCDDEHLGEVVAKASPAGREAVEKLFPDCFIDWRGLGPDTAVFPDDWKEFTFVIPGLLRDLARLGSTHNLPRHLLGLRPIDELVPDQYATLMMVGAKDQGVRAALWSDTDQRLVIVHGASTVN